MEGVLKNQLRRFVAAEHIKNVLNGEWVEMFDDLGRKLPGIRGRVGVSAQGLMVTKLALISSSSSQEVAFPSYAQWRSHPFRNERRRYSNRGSRRILANAGRQHIHRC